MFIMVNMVGGANGEKNQKLTAQEIASIINATEI